MADDGEAARGRDRHERAGGLEDVRACVGSGGLDLRQARVPAWASEGCPCWACMLVHMLASEPKRTGFAAHRACTARTEHGAGHMRQGTGGTAHDARRTALALAIAMTPELAPAPPAPPTAPRFNSGTRRLSRWGRRARPPGRERGGGQGGGARVGRWGRPHTRAGGGARLHPRRSRSLAAGSERPGRYFPRECAAPAVAQCLPSREARPEGGRRPGQHGAPWTRRVRLGSHGEWPLLEVDDAAVLEVSRSGALGWLVRVCTGMCFRDLGAFGFGRGSASELVA